jgi:phosphatidylglycerol---prolipoprotein diacylglyceryl transferase
MEDATITFPMLGSNFAFTVPGNYTIFGMTLHWYGTIIALGFLLAYLYADHRTKDFGMTSDDFLSALICAVPAAIIGARLYYVIFNYSIYTDNFWDVFKIWKGGIAVYGSIIGAMIGILIYCRVKKTPIAPYLDVGAFGLLIGQAIGRWGNFMNREAYGAATTAFCRMGLTDASGNTIYVHPTFLYESLWNALGFILLHFFSKKVKRRYDGQIFVMYIAWYGLGRMFIEGLRTDSLYLFDTGIRVSQLLAALSFAAALIFLAVNHFRPHDEGKMLINRKTPDTSPLEKAPEGKKH